MSPGSLKLPVRELLDLHLDSTVLSPWLGVSYGARSKDRQRTLYLHVVPKTPNKTLNSLLKGWSGICSSLFADPREGKLSQPLR